MPLLKVGVLADEDIGEPIDPKRPGKASVMGDKALGSNVTVECTVPLAPSIPRPDSASCSSGIGVGGVGVRGGAGMGRLEAIVVLN